MRAARSVHTEFDLRELGRMRRHRRATAKVALRAVRRSPLSWLKYSALSILALIVTKATLVEAFFIPSASMMPTLQEKDYILVPKFLYGLRLPLLDDVLLGWRAPKRGDIVVFRRDTQRGSEAPGGKTLVKRVVALEGDIIEILDGQVYLNGIALAEPYTHGSDSGRAGYHFGPYRVPKDKVFVLGDNRDNSEDSRFWTDPFVSTTHILGRAVIVYWSAAERDRAGIVL